MPRRPTLDRLLKRIDFYQPPPQLQQALQVFDRLPEAQVQQLTSGKYIKSWQAGLVIQYLPAARLTPYVASLVTHLQDANWPAFPHVADALVKLGELAIPAIQHVFATEKSDGLWITYLIRAVIQYWDRALQERLTDDLREYVRYAERDGASIIALDALEGLVPEEEHRRLYQYLCTQYADRPEELTDLRQTFRYDGESTTELA